MTALFTLYFTLIFVKSLFGKKKVGIRIQKLCMYIRWFRTFLDFKVHIKVLWRLQFLEYSRTLSLKFQKARTKIEVILSLPCWLSQFSWDFKLGETPSTYNKACGHGTFFLNTIEIFLSNFLDGFLLFLNVLLYAIYFGKYIVHRLG